MSISSTPTPTTVATSLVEPANPSEVPAIVSTTPEDWRDVEKVDLPSWLAGSTTTLLLLDRGDHAGRFRLAVADARRSEVFDLPTGDITGYFWTPDGNNVGVMDSQAQLVHLISIRTGLISRWHLDEASLLPPLRLGELNSPGHPLGLRASGNDLSDTAFHLALEQAAQTTDMVYVAAFSPQGVDTCSALMISAVNWHHVVSVDCQDPALDVIDFTWSPSTHILATLEGQFPPDDPFHPIGRLVSLYDADTGELREAFPGAYAAELGSISSNGSLVDRGLLWSPDNRYLLDFKQGGGAVPCLLDTLTAQDSCFDNLPSQFPDASLALFRFSPDGLSLMYAANSGSGFSICATRLIDGSVSCPIRTAAPGRSAISYKVSDDGALIAILDDRSCPGCDFSREPEATLYDSSGRLLMDFGKQEDPFMGLGTWAGMLFQPREKTD